MVQISRRPLDKDVFIKLFTLFFQVVGKKDNKEEFERVTNDLFSKTEKIMIMKRIAIIYLLLQNKDQRSVAQTVKVSISTVSKFSLIVKKSEGVVPYLQKILRNKKIAELFEDVFGLIAPPTRYGADWSAGRKLEYQKRKQRGRGI